MAGRVLSTGNAGRCADSVSRAIHSSSCIELPAIALLDCGPDSYIRYASSVRWKCDEILWELRASKEKTSRDTRK